VKVNKKSCPCALSHEGVWGSGCTYPHFLDIGTSWKWAVSFTPRPLYLRGKNPRYPLDRRLGGPRTCLDDVEKKNSYPYRDSNSDSSTFQSVVIHYTDWAILASKLPEETCRKDCPRVCTVALCSYAERDPRPSGTTECNYSLLNFKIFLGALCQRLSGKQGSERKLNFCYV
jgi:hypothetical protein